jgi:hypothetical protein
LAIFAAIRRALVLREQLGLLKPDSDMVSHAAAADLSFFGQTTAAHLPR